MSHTLAPQLAPQQKKVLQGDGIQGKNWPGSKCVNTASNYGLSETSDYHTAIGPIGLSIAADYCTAMDSALSDHFCAYCAIGLAGGKSSLMLAFCEHDETPELRASTRYQWTAEIFT